MILRCFTLREHPIGKRPLFQSNESLFEINQIVQLQVDCSQHSEGKIAPGASTFFLQFLSGKYLLSPALLHHTALEWHPKPTFENAKRTEWQFLQLQLELLQLLRFQLFQLRINFSGLYSLCCCGLQLHQYLCRRSKELVESNVLFCLMKLWKPPKVNFDCVSMAFCRILRSGVARCSPMLRSGWPWSFQSLSSSFSIMSSTSKNSIYSAKLCFLDFKLEGFIKRENRPKITNFDYNTTIWPANCFQEN